VLLDEAALAESALVFSPLDESLFDPSFLTGSPFFEDVEDRESVE
jgi:hypothetical protein